MRRASRVLIAVLVLAACRPPGPIAPPPPPRFGSVACNHALPGSRVLADIDADGIPIVCEAQRTGTPADATGWWDGHTIHVWPNVVPQPETYTQEVAGHEYGHALAQRHRGWVPAWEAARGLGDGTGDEDFATSWAWCNYPRPIGVGYGFRAGTPTASQCALLASWYAAR